MIFELPDCLLFMFSNNYVKVSIDYKTVSAKIEQLSSFEWKESSGYLSKDHVYWDIIYRKTVIVKKLLTVEMGFSVDPFYSNGLFFLEILY